MKPDISIIICTHNRGHLLPKTLQSLADQDLEYSRYEVIIVDDGGTDNTDEVIKSLSMPYELSYYRIEKGGRAKARNIGLDKARGRIALFCDDDVLAPKSFLSCHLKLHEGDSKAVGRGPIIDIEKHEFPGDLKPTIKDCSTAMFCTCNVSVDREGFIKEGGFNELFTEYGWEDNEAGYRLKKAGYHLKFSMDAYIYHFRPIWVHHNLDVMIGKAMEQGRSAVIYYRLHPDWKVQMATGIHPIFQLWWNITASKWISDMCHTLWKNHPDWPRWLRELLGRKVFLHYYNESIKATLKKQK
ncbi:MAG: glycosyltransferase [Candidatus Eremiobacteraeota bacterium]|nr:glycosyltransferase [Candidatus Eremiobacteraeota bacterium]